MEKQRIIPLADIDLDSGELEEKFITAESGLTREDVRQFNSGQRLT